MAVYTASVNLAATLYLQGQTALIVGGGNVAVRRAQTLLAAGLTLKVVAPQLAPELLALQATTLLKLELHQRTFAASDLSRVCLVVACTSSAAVNDEVTRLALAAGVLVNHAGRAEAGNLRFPATLKRGRVSVAISSGSELPMLAQALREKVATALEDVPEVLPIEAWTLERDAALRLSGEAKQTALGELRSQIRMVVGL